MAFNSRLFITLSLRRYTAHLPLIGQSLTTLATTSFSDAHKLTKLGDAGLGNLNTSNPDESYVLDNLSNLLPVSRNFLIQRGDGDSDAQVHDRRAVVDAFLLPEDRLRGVFMQKLKGKCAVETALSKAGVADIGVDLMAKVLDRGNLGGESMVMFFHWAIKQPKVARDIHSYNILIRALARRNFLEFVVKILHELKADGSIRPNLETFSLVMDGLVKDHRVRKAIQMFGNGEEFGFECNTKSLDILLQCLCTRGHVGAAASYFNKMKGKIPFNATTYNIIIGGWSKCGRVDEIEKVLEAMVGDGFSPDCSTSSFLIKGLGKAGRTEDAVDVFEKLKDKGCIPDTSVYNAVIGNFVSVGKFDECMVYYRCLLRSNNEPNADTYTKLIYAFIKARKVADALEMFNEMVGHGIVPTTGTITCFLERLCSFGPPYAAMSIYESAQKAECKVSLTAYKLLLMRLSRFGKCGMLLKIWEDLQASGYTSDVEVYEYVVNGLCNIGQLENAVLVMEEALGKGFCPNKLIYSKLNNKLLASSKVERAYKLFLKVKVARQEDNARKFWRRNGWHF
ncbi:Putative pentatricopeptide repeat-containing protein At5g43820 [Linum grandiflorum]